MSTTTHRPSVRELMSIDPVTIGADEPALHAEQQMSDNRVSGLPVVDGDGTLVGVISQSDLVRAHATGQELAAWPGLTVRHLMTAPALTIQADAPLQEAARRMEERRVHRLVVIEPAGQRPIGVLSTLDLAALLVELLEARDAS